MPTLTVSAQPQPGRPPYTPEQEAAIRRRLVDIARALFTEEGFNSVSMRKIAARADCSPMALYRYFANKRALLRYIWEDIFVDVFEQCAKAVAGEETPGAQLRAFARVYLDYWFAHPDHYRVIFLNEDAVGGEGDQYYVFSSDILERLGLVRDLFASGIAAGDFAAGDAELFAQQFLCSLQGLAHCLITIPEYPWHARDALVTGTVDTLLRGFASSH